MVPDHLEDQQDLSPRVLTELEQEAVRVVEARPVDPSVAQLPRVGRPEVPHPQRLDRALDVPGEASGFEIPHHQDGKTGRRDLRLRIHRRQGSTPRFAGISKSDQRQKCRQGRVSGAVPGSSPAAAPCCRSGRSRDSGAGSRRPEVGAPQRLLTDRPPAFSTIAFQACLGGHGVPVQSVPERHCLMIPRGRGDGGGAG
jgi:hypothetical protein